MDLLALGASDCEAFHGGWLGQPANGLSSLAYVVAGVYVMRQRGPKAPASALAVVGIGSLLYHGPMPQGAEAIHDASLVVLVATILSEAWRRRSLPRPTPLAVAALAAAIAINLLTRTGAPLCRPNDLAQGHAVWHILTAVAASAWLARWEPRSAPRRAEAS